MLAAPPITRLGGIALDATSIYALDRGTYPDENDGRFLSAPKSGGTLSTFGTVIHGQAGPLMDGAELVVSSCRAPVAGDPGAELRPVRYSRQGIMTELVSPMLAQVGGGSLAADPTALYFGATRSPGTVARLAR